jgi:hypothetical protein
VGNVGIYGYIVVAIGVATVGIDGLPTGCNTHFNFFMIHLLDINIVGFVGVNPMN